MSGRTYIAMRTDGLGERLKALINAMTLADVTGGDFIFRWRPISADDLPYHDIVAPEAMFDPAFLAAHYRPAPPQGVVMLDTVVSEIMQGRPGKGETVRVDQNMLSLEMRDAPRVFDFSGRFERAFWNIRFSPELEIVRDLARQADLPANAAALHLRAGDIIYGRYRFLGRYVGKIYPYPLAIHVVEDCLARGIRPIVFGQDTAFIAWLRERYGVLLPTDFLEGRELSRLQSAIYEISLMTRCQTIYAGSSGFPGVAGLVSGGKVVAPGKLASVEDAREIISTCLASGPVDPRITDMQRAMAAWFAIKLDRRLVREEGLRLADLAFHYDPTNFLYALHAADILYRQGQALKAEGRIAAVLENGSPGLAHFLKHMRDKPFKGQVVVSPYLESLCAAGLAGHPMAAFCAAFALRALGESEAAQGQAQAFLNARPDRFAHLDVNVLNFTELDKANDARV